MPGGITDTWAWGRRLKNQRCWNHSVGGKSWTQPFPLTRVFLDQPRTYPSLTFPYRLCRYLKKLGMKKSVLLCLQLVCHWRWICAIGCNQTPGLKTRGKWWDRFCGQLAATMTILQNSWIIFKLFSQILFILSRENIIPHLRIKPILRYITGIWLEDAKLSRVVLFSD